MNKKITDFYILANKLKNKVRTGWIEYDKPKYDDDELFKKLICDIQKLDTL